MPIPNEERTFYYGAEDKVLRQLHSSALVFAFNIQDRCYLLLEGVAKPPSGTQARVNISVQGRTPGRPVWKVLWSADFLSGQLDRGGKFTSNVPLDAFAGKMTEIKISVESPAKYSRAQVLWEKMSLVCQKENKQPARPGRARYDLTARIRNVVIIVLDAARADYFGSYGNNSGLTPNIDAFARSAFKFKNAVTPAPYTIAAISSMFSGLLPESHGVRDVYSHLDEELPNLPRILKENGYYTLAMTGSIFTSGEYGLVSHCDDVFYLRPDETEEKSRSTMDLPTIEKGISKAADSGKNAFIFIHLLPPHGPYNPPPPFEKHLPKTKTQRSSEKEIETLFRFDLLNTRHPLMRRLNELYMNNLRYADHITGRILELLKKYDLFQDSMIIITADHGEAFGEHGFFNHNKDVHDEMIRIPLLIRIPGVESRVVDESAGLVDVLPTLIDILSLEYAGFRFEGRSLAPVLIDGQRDGGGFYYSRATGESPIFSFRSERYKYVSLGHKEAIYDLKDDPHETVNIASRHPVLATFLRQQGMIRVFFTKPVGRSQARETELSEETVRELKNLGYIN